MKTKILFTFLLFASIAFYSKADVVIVISQHGTPKYREVIIRDRVLSCLGAGSNMCPADAPGGQYKIAGVPVGEITNYVQKEIATGNTDGQTNYKGFLPCSWKIIDDESVEIRIDAEKIDGVSEK